MHSIRFAGSAFHTGQKFMSSATEPHRVPRLRRVAIVAVVIAIVLASLALIGWLTGVEVLTSLVLGGASMRPIVSLILLAAAVALAWRLMKPASKALHFAAVAVLLSTTLLAVENARSEAPAAGEHLATAAESMTPPITILALALLGIAQFLLDAKRRRPMQVGEWAALMCVALAIAVLIGYAYREMLFSGGGHRMPMSFNTALAIGALGVALLCARPERTLVSLLTSDTLGGITARRLLPAAVLVPILLGWLRLAAEQLGWVDPRFGMALFALAGVAVFTAIIFWNAGLLHRVDQRARLSQQALAASEERHRNIINAASDSFLAMNADGLIVEWNRQAEQSFGWSRAETIGRELAEVLIPPAFRELHRQGLARFLATGSGPILNKRIEITALHRDGHEIPIELTVTPIRLQSAWLFGAFVLDITARKQTDAALHRAKEAAEAASRAKSEFLANMSHEIRTPLNGVLGMTELALDTELNAEQREYLEMAKTSADYLLAVINDILDFSKIEAGKLDLETIDFDVRALVDDTVTALALRAHKKGLELLGHLAADVPAGLAGDPNRLRQVLMNLVGNAIKFTERGEVVVSVERQPPADGIVELHFAVHDTGIGIPVSRQSALFQAFSQVDASTTRKYGGTGLGLAISYSLVQMMGGRLWLESEEGRGSTFHFTARFSLASAPIPATTTLDPQDLPELAVLVVDDNATNRRILAEMLGNWHMLVTVADCGAQALEVMQRALDAGRAFDLVLLDNMMPEMDGFSLAEKIKQHPGLVGATLLMLSSADRRADTARLRELGLAAYLAKPVKQSELLDSIVNVLGLAKEAKPRQRSTHVSFGHAQRKLHVLLAEDNAVNQKLAVRLLEKRGHSVVVCSNGRAALEMLESERFDAVLLDVQMPELDGLETTAAIRARERGTGQQVPIIAMTAHAMKGDREHCLEAGMNGYVIKPLEPRALFETLESLVPPEHPAEKAADNAAAGVKPACDPAIPIFNEEEALGRVEGDRELLSELVGIFLSQYTEWTTEIRAALADHDATRLKRVAHALKGAALNLAIVRTAELARACELAEPAADWQAVEQKAASLLAALDEFAATEAVARLTAGK